jgi:hypothetical protein
MGDRLMANEFQYLKFGRFLLDKKRITATDVINARILQKKTFSSENLQSLRDGLQKSR